MSLVLSIWLSVAQSLAPQGDPGVCVLAELTAAPATGPRCALDGTDDDPHCWDRAPVAPAPRFSSAPHGQIFVLPVPGALSAPPRTRHPSPAAAPRTPAPGFARRIERPPRLFASSR